MRFWVEIQDAAETVIGEGPISNIARCSIKKRVNRVGEFSFEMPALDERAELVVARNRAHIYGMIGGVKTLLGGGPIDELTTRIGPNGAPMLQVSGGDFLRELGRITVGKLTLDDVDPDDNVELLLGMILGAPLRWDSYTRLGNSPDFRARFVYESLWNSLLAVAEKTGAYMRWEEEPGVGPRGLHWFYAAADSGILATMHGDPVALESNENACLITNLEIVEDSNDLKTRAYLFGAGEGDSVITSFFANSWPDATSIEDPYVVDGQEYEFVRAGNYIRNVTAELTYDQDESALAFKDIAPLTNELSDLIFAANFLVTAAMEHLHKNHKPYKSYKLSVAGLNTTLEPGRTIRVQARRFRDGEKPINVDEDLFVLEVENTIDVNGARTTGLTVANLFRWPYSGSEEIAREMGKSKILSAHPQTGPNVDTIPYREHVDDTHNATLHFWLGEETTTVQSVIVRFRVDPLRSTVKSIAGASTTTGGGSSHTHTIPDHQHQTTIANTAVVDLPASFTIVGGNVVLNYAGASSGDKTLNTTPGGGNVTSGSNESTHTHTLTPVITSSYGVFDESGGNTYAATDLEWKTEADVSWTAVVIGDAISGATGWYQIDITDNISADGRPTTAVNDVQFRVIAASHATKSAQLTVQIERRTSIQSIAVY